MGCLSKVGMKPHVLCVPFPAQGHIDPMLKLAKLLNSRGFHITFVNTEFNHQRLIRSRGPKAVESLNDFRFKTIPDGLPPSNPDSTQDMSALGISIKNYCLDPFLHLIRTLNESSDTPPISCIVSDPIMSFTLQASQDLGIPEVAFFTTSACGFLGYFYFPELIKKGYVPFKDESCFINGYLDTPIDWIPGMEGIRLRDMPTFIRTTDPDDLLLNDSMRKTHNTLKAKGLILNTFDDLEHEVLETIRSKFTHVYTIGPLQLLHNQIIDNNLKSIQSNLWKEDMGCLEWLDKREPNSVVYVNFGSITVITDQQLIEFAWGLANSKHPFLWVIRPDLVRGESVVISKEFAEETRGRCMLAGWCPQEQVLKHPSIGGFLTHCGWNSTIESLSEGVPMICWPFFSEQPTNCRYACTKWGVGMDIEGDVKRDAVEKLVRELMEGEKGRDMRKKASEWKEKAQLATQVGGSSYLDSERLVEDMLAWVSTEIEKEKLKVVSRLLHPRL